MSTQTSNLIRPRRSRLRSTLFTIALIVVLLAATLLTFSITSKLPGTYSMAPAVGSNDTGSMNMGSTAITHSVTDYALAQCSGPTSNFNLEAKEIQQDGKTLYSYNGTVPGPLLRVKQGDCVSVTLTNHLSEPTAIHWHGINVPNAADGVPGVTQDSVKPGATYTYRFIAKDAGTYWYHTHQDTINQLPKGLYGGFVVEPTAGTGANQDYYLTYANGNLVNGSATDVPLTAQPGDKVRLRLLNAMKSDTLDVALLGTPFRIVAKDGGDINRPSEISNLDIALGVGERYDLEFVMPASGMVKLIDLHHPETVSLGSGAAPAAAANLPTFELTSYGAPMADPLADRTNFDVSADITLDNHIGFYNGTIGLIHTINGETPPNTLMVNVKQGDTVRLRFVNNTNENHPMHLHGHHFTVLLLNGKKPVGSPIHADTVDIAPHSSGEVAFIADNPGLWMSHCHILYHAASGMMFMVNYAGVGTPFKSGVDQQNISE